MKPLKKIFRVILLTLNTLVLLCLVLSAFSEYISPYHFVFFSYLGLFFPFILVGNIAVFLAWLLFKQWKLALLHIVIFGICGGAIYTYCPLHKKTQTIPDDAIKILTYNVMRFNGLSKNDPGNPPNKILQFIQENDADIVCIQEFGASKNNPNFLTEDDIMDALKKYPYNYFHSLQFPYQSEDFSLAIFSRFPILSSQKVPYDSPYNGSFETELDINGKRVTLINNHLESNKLSIEERNNYYRLTTRDVDAQSLDAFTQTMTKRLTPAFKARAFQAQVISRLIKENKNPYIIVCGDFNDTPISYARHKIIGNDLRDAFVNSGFGLGITYNRYRFLFRIDYILHSKNIQSYNCTVGNLKSSDHYPLWCYLQLN